MSFLYNTSGDLSKIDILLRDEVMGIIGIGGDIVEWKPANGIYVFHISRQPNQLWASESQYIITIEIFTNLGTKLLELRFNEIDALRILDCFAVYSNEYPNEIDDDEMYIHINPNNTRLETHVIKLHRIMQQRVYVNQYGQQVTHNDDIIFTISQVSNTHQNMVNLVSMNLSYEELDDLAFKLFFVGLIDISDIREVSYEYNEAFSRVENYIVSKNTSKPRNFSVF